MYSFYDHFPGDPSCPVCDKPPQQCDTCGGVVHFEVTEQQSPFLGITALEEAECDVCGPDYTF